MPYVGSRGWYEMLSFITIHLGFWGKGLSVSSELTGWLDWLGTASSSDLCSHSPSHRVTSACYQPQRSCGCRDPNSSFYDCKADTFPMKPSSQAHFCTSLSSSIHLLDLAYLLHHCSGFTGLALCLNYPLLHCVWFSFFWASNILPVYWHC